MPGVTHSQMPMTLESTSPPGQLRRGHWPCLRSRYIEPSKPQLFIMCVYSPLTLHTPCRDLGHRDESEASVLKAINQATESPEATHMTYCSQNGLSDSLREKHWSLLPELDPWGAPSPISDQPPQPKKCPGVGTQAGGEKTTEECWKEWIR